MDVQDVWTCVVTHMTFEDICLCRVVCRTWHELLVGLERTIACDYARDVLGDSAFWTRAYCRPEATRRSLLTWHAELVRLDAFMRLTRRMKAVDFYQLWDVVDVVHDGEAHPPSTYRERIWRHAGWEWSVQQERV